MILGYPCFRNPPCGVFFGEIRAQIRRVFLKKWWYTPQNVTLHAKRENMRIPH